MATIDQLFVKLFLDPSDFEKGQKDAVAAAQKGAADIGAAAAKGEKAQTDAQNAVLAGLNRLSAAMEKSNERNVQAAKKTAEGNRKVGESFEGALRKGLAFVALLAGAKSIEDFTRRITALDAAVGRMAHNVGQSPEWVSGIGRAVERMGGNFDGAVGGLRRLSDGFQELRTTGSTAILEPLARLQALSGKAITFGKDVRENFLSIADALKAEDAKNPAMADFLGRQILGDEGLVNEAKKGRSGVLADEAESRKHGVVSPADAKAAQDLQKAYGGLSQSVTDLGTKIETALSPYVTELLTKLTTLIDTDVKPWVESLGKYLDDHKLEIEAFGTALGDIVTPAAEVAGAFGAGGAMMLALNAFVGLLTGPLIGGIRGVTTAMGLLSAIPVPAWFLAVLAASGFTQWNQAKQTTDILQHADPAKNDVVVDPTSGFAQNVQPGAGNQVVGTADPKTGWFQRLQRFLGFGGGADDTRVKDAILSTAQSTKKLADASDNGDGAPGTGGGVGAPSLRYGRDPATGGYRRGGHSGGGRNYADTPAGQGRAGAVKGTQGERALAAMDYLVKEKGYTPEGAAIAVGNAMQESGVNAGTRPGDSGISHSMFQWNHERWAAYQKFSAERGKSTEDNNNALDFFDQERKHRSGLEAEWHKQTDLRNAGRLGHLFEGYGDNSEGTRVQNARDILAAWRQRHSAAPAPTASAPASKPTSFRKRPRTYSEGGGAMPSYDTAAPDGPMTTVDHRDPRFAPAPVTVGDVLKHALKPVPVEVTDKSAEKIGKQSGREMLDSRKWGAVDQRIKATERMFGHTSWNGMGRDVLDHHHSLMAASAVHHHYAGSTTNNDNSSQTKIGSITVHTRATNAEQMAADLEPVFQRGAAAGRVNYGLG